MFPHVHHEQHILVMYMLSFYYVKRIYGVYTMSVHTTVV